MFVANYWLLILLGLQAIWAIEKPGSLTGKYEDLLSLAMVEYNKMSNAKYWWIPVKILDIRTIQNTGMHFSIKIAIALSNCTKVAHSNFDSKNCKATKAIGLKACIFEIFQPSWKIPGKIKLSTCSDYVSPEQIDDASSTKSNSVTMKSLESAINSENLLEHKMELAWESFLGFMKKFKREYSSVAEQLDRFRIYMQNMHFSSKLQFEEKGTAIFGVTQFSDMTREEFQQTMLPSLWSDHVKPSNGVRFNLDDFNLTMEHLPKKFDWREKGAVTAVKNQGSCGSCWAFSVTGNIEGAWAIKTGKLISLSEQELIDCDKVDQGCNGGLPINAFHEIQRMGGMEPEDEYPYKAKNGTCRLTRSEIAVTIDDAVEIPNNETVMKAWIAQRGPLSVGIDAELLGFYQGGILHPSRSRCPPSKINHGVLIVGYGIEKGLPYWLIKNSWGKQWGEDGYFRLMRGKDVCGVSDMVSSAIIY